MCHKSTLPNLMLGQALLYKIMHSLAWSMDEIGRLIDLGRKVHVQVQILIEYLQQNKDFVRVNVPRQIADLKNGIINGVYCYRCTNGEWNTLWCRGNTRSLSILQIRAAV